VLIRGAEGEDEVNVGVNVSIEDRLGIEVSQLLAGQRQSATNDQSCHKVMTLVSHLSIVPFKIDELAVLFSIDVLA
jgi:hypothetical protein